MATLIEQDAANAALCLVVILLASFALVAFKVLVLDPFGLGDRLERAADKAWRRGTKVNRDNQC